MVLRTIKGLKHLLTLMVLRTIKVKFAKKPRVQPTVRCLIYHQFFCLRNKVFKGNFFSIAFKYRCISGYTVP